MAKQNCIVAQAGGPTAVINNSLYGVIKQAKKQPEIGKIYGAINGVIGILREELVDLGKENKEILNGLTFTPGAALGSCRYRLGSEREGLEEINKIIENLSRYGMKYFFYIGGNDSMDTANKIYEIAMSRGYDLRVIGIPKTIDNDLVLTDHCPGFGSAAKCIATAVREAGYHAESLYGVEKVTILETFGRNTGWLAGASALARKSATDAPHLIYFPEVPFSLHKFKEDVKKICMKIGGAFIVAAEGIKDEKGNLFSLQTRSFSADSFGHPVLGKAGYFLTEFVNQEMGLVAQNIKPDISQQSAAHLIARVDAQEAKMVGEEAVKYAVSGKSGFMVTLVRNNGPTHNCTTSLAELGVVANRERKIPRNWISEQGNFVKQDFIRYVHPLIQGEIKVPLKEGLPAYVRLKRCRISQLQNE